MMICSRCGCNETDGYKKWCVACLSAEKVFRELRANPVSNACMHCGIKLSGKKHTCHQCAAKEFEYQKIKRRSRHNKGMCTKCGKEPVIGTKKWCVLCLSAESAYRNNLRAGRRLKGLCIQCDTETTETRCGRCKEAHNASKRQLLQRTRDIVFNAYGGYKCSCPRCPETSSDKSFYTIDHINEDGAEHRRSMSSTNTQIGVEYYRSIINSKFQIELQILCWNCNLSKYRHNGICAHMNLNK